jgi:hypothetical protein
VELLPDRVPVLAILVWFDVSFFLTWFAVLFDSSRIFESVVGFAHQFFTDFNNYKYIVNYSQTEKLWGMVR